MNYLLWQKAQRSTTCGNGINSNNNKNLKHSIVNVFSWSCEICWVITEYSMGTQRLKEYESRKGHFKWKVLLKSTNNIYSLRNGWINNAYIAMKWYRRMKLRYYSCNGFLKEYRNMECYSWFVLKIPTNFHLKGNCLVWYTTIFWFCQQLFIWLPLDEILCNSSWSSHLEH